MPLPRSAADTASIPPRELVVPDGSRLPHCTRTERATTAAEPASYSRCMWPCVIPGWSRAGHLLAVSRV